MANNKTITTELDFDQIKTNLKSFMQGQTQFSDYDFEGSAMAVLIDLLAYNTHYNALYKNMVVNESFLDSASKRSSVVSRAKEIGYIPFSATSSIATVNIVVSSTTTTPFSLILPAYTVFNTIVDGVTYNFYTLEDIIAVLDSGTNTYTYPNVVLREGTPLNFKYVADVGQTYIIPNLNVDLSTLKVRVQNSALSSTFTTFYRQENIVSLGATDPVYFVKEIENQYYQLEFGNDIIGKALQPGNIVNLQYLSCNTSAPNGAKIFAYQGSSLLGGVISVTTTTAAYAGSIVEDIESIRYNAPRAYSNQNRAVTVDDYKSLIYQNYPPAGSINVWGGEDNSPPVYGKVFICIKPKVAQVLTQVEKEYVIREVLKKKNVVTITPELVDAEYILLEINVSVYYNSRLTVNSSNQLTTLIHKTITNYNTTYLNKFDGIFRFSKLSSLIDNSEASITNNIMSIKLHRRVNVKYNTITDYTINLANPIYASGVPEESVVSTGFYIAGNTNIMYVEDLPNADKITGVFRMYYYSNIVGSTILNKVYVKNFGSINYSTGKMVMSSLNITGVVVPFELIIKSQSNDVVSIRNQLVQIPENTININMILDKVSIGDAAGNANYIFSSSRN